MTLNMHMHDGHKLSQRTIRTLSFEEEMFLVLDLDPAHDPSLLPIR